MRTTVVPSTYYMQIDPSAVDVNRNTDHKLRTAEPLQAGPLCYQIIQIVIIVGGVCWADKGCCMYLHKLM